MPLSNRYKTFKSRIFQFFVILAIFCLIFSFKYRVTLCVGESMEPTFKNPELLLINKRAYATNSPKRFDVVALFDPVMNEMLIKRIIGLPNEKIEIINGEFYINGSYLKYPFSSERVDGPYYSTGPIVLSSNSYFYIGDARETSCSGIFLQEQLMGRVGD